MEVLVSFIVSVVANAAARFLDLTTIRPRVFGEPERLNDRIRHFNDYRQQIVSEVLLSCYPGLRSSILHVDGAVDHPLPAVPLLWRERGDSPKNFIEIDPNLADERDEEPVDYRLIAFLERSGRRMYESDVYRLMAVGKTGHLVCGVTTYYKALTTCDRFFFELVERLPRKMSPFRLRALSRRRFIKRWREKVRRVVDLHQFGHLSAAVGISVLTIFARQRESGAIDYVYLCVQNSDQKNNALDRHVIPAFMYEPVTQGFGYSEQEEMDLSFQVLREFGEDVLGMEELEKPSLHRDAMKAMLNGNQACRELSNLLRTGEAELTTTGLWFDILRLRPEVSCVLIVRDPRYYETFKAKFIGNWEGKKNARWARLASESDYRSLLLDTEVPMCPPGAGALVAGRTHAMTRLGLETEA